MNKITFGRSHLLEILGTYRTQVISKKKDFKSTLIPVLRAIASITNRNETKYTSHISQSKTLRRGLHLKLKIRSEQRKKLTIEGPIKILM